MIQVPVERDFIKQAMKRVELESFLARELERAGYGSVDIRRVLTGTRVTIYVERPGMVIGRKGRSIKQLTDDLEQKFGLEKPQVEVVEIPKPELSGPIMAKHIAFALERGISARSLGHRMVSRIMNAGARGVEIVISGRFAGERSKSSRFYAGYLAKAGEPAEKFVSHGQAVAKLKPGIVGVKVSIMPPGVSLPGEIKVVREPSEGESQVKPEGKEPSGDEHQEPPEALEGDAGKEQEKVEVGKGEDVADTEG